jgi:hypothetical protein
LNWFEQGSAKKNRAHKANVKIIEEKFQAKYSFVNIYDQNIALEEPVKIKKINKHDEWIIEKMI